MKAMSAVRSLVGMRGLTACAVTSACLLAAGEAKAVVLALETFESYTAGSVLNGQNGGSGWTGAWGSTAQATVQNASLVDPNGFVSGGGKALQLQLAAGADVGNIFNRSFGSTSSTVYMSYLVLVDSFEDNDFLSVSGSNGAVGNAQDTLSSGVRNNVGNPIYSRVGTSGTGDTDNVVSGAGSTVPDNTTFLVVAKYTKDAGSLTYNRTDVYVNPTSPFEPAAPSATSIETNAPDKPTINALSMVTGRFLASDNTDRVVLDSIRVATTFHEALGVSNVAIDNKTFQAAADAYVQNGTLTSTNFGTSSVLQVKNSAQVDFDRKAWIRFEAPVGGTFANAVSGQLALTIDTTGNPGTDANTSWTFQIFGLAEGAAGQSWVEGNGGADNIPVGEITWANAPGNDITNGSDVNLLDMFSGAPLATFTITGRGVNGTQILLDEPGIANFLRADTDGKLTFVLTRLTLENNTATNSVVHQFRSAESTAGGGPELRVGFAVIVPEPSVAILSLLSLGGLALRRRREM